MAILLGNRHAMAQVRGGRRKAVGRGAFFFTGAENARRVRHAVHGQPPAEKKDEAEGPGSLKSGRVFENRRVYRREPR